MPVGGFEDAAERRQLLAEQDAAGVVSGYILWRTSTHRTVSIAHLCVETASRGRGIARALFAGVCGANPNAYEIRVRCRRDFAANDAWPRLGFVAVGEDQGRAGMLTNWRYELQPLPLLGLLQKSEQLAPVVRAAIDANVFFDLDDAGPGHEASRGLAADWLGEFVELVVTQQLFNEIDRSADVALRDRQRQRAHTFPVLQRVPRRELEVLPRIRELLPPALRESTDSDARQLAMAIAGGVHTFVSRDEVLLGICDELNDSFDIQVVAPHEAISHFDELRRFELYRPRRLFMGPGVVSARARADDVESMAALLHQGHPAPEPLNRTRARLRELLSHPDRYDTTNVSSDGRLLASFVIERRDERELRVPFFAVADVPLGPTAARHYGENFLSLAATEGRSLVVIERSDQRVEGALQELGYTLANDVWSKIGLRFGGLFGGVLPLLDALATHPQSGEVAHHLRNQVEFLGRSSEISPHAVAEIERRLWPAKFACTGLPSFIVPIRPAWAAELFDVDLSRETLFGAAPGVALNSENAYYRSPQPRMPTAPARVLWYVSENPQFQGTKAIRACSYVDEVLIGPPKELFRRYRRLGVYNWREVLDLADGDLEHQVMAFRFSRTERFPNPILWEQLQRALERHTGRGSPIAGPVAISDECFFDLYGMATTRNDGVRGSR